MKKSLIALVITRKIRKSLNASIFVGRKKPYTVENLHSLKLRFIKLMTY